MPSFLAVALIIIGGLAAAAYLGGSSAPSHTSAPVGPPGAGPFLNETGLPAFTSTTASQPPGREIQSPLYLPGTPPPGLLSYDNMPFEGLQGSYCWPPSRAQCVDVTSLDPAGFPVVAVYPRPNVTFSSTFWRGIQGVFIRLYDGSSPTPVFSGEVTGYHPFGFPLNFTSGSHLLSVFDYYGGGAEVSSYYNLTTVRSPSATIDHGLKVQVGSPGVHYFSVSTPNYTVTGPMWEDWPVTVYSNATTSVDLSAASVIYGNWVEFVPSHLTDVGPSGATTHMLISGAVRPFVDNDISNVSLMVRASGGGGELGQALIPLEGSEYVGVFRATGAPNMTIGALSPYWATQGQTGYEAYALVYDPGGVPSDASLQVDLSIVGMINGSGVYRLPPWLALDLLNPSITLQAFQPVYFQFSTRTAADAPVGDYAFLVRASVGGQSGYLVVPFEVMYPMTAGTA